MVNICNLFFSLCHHYVFFSLQWHFVSHTCIAQAGEVVLVSFLSFLLSISEIYSTERADCSCPFCADDRVLPQVSYCGINGAWRVTGIGFSPTILVFPCHYYSIAAPYSYYIHLLTMRYDLNNWQTREMKHLSLSFPPLPLHLHQQLNAQHAVLKTSGFINWGNFLTK